MTRSVDQSFRNVLLDIEGTTTPINFVSKVLFPYARSHVEEFLERHGTSPDVCQDLDGLRREHVEDTRRSFNPPALRNPQEPASFVAYIDWLIGRDRKSTPLKSLQGKIWEEGYTRGELRSQVFEDVPPALRRWQEQKKIVSIFSSGSILAQKLLFTYTAAGDLTRHLSAYFDTTIGTKTDPVSYQTIASVLRRSPSDILFISDVVPELGSADSVGLGTLLCERPGNHPQPANTFQIIHSFDQVFP